MALESNVVFGMFSGLALLMDIYRPESTKGYGIVFVPGSGWRRPLCYNAEPLKESAQVEIYVPALLESGYTVFVINHRATPRFLFPAALEDVQRAVRFIKYNATEFGIDREWVGIGGSSGGHLVSLLGVMDGEGDFNDLDPINREVAKVHCVVARAAPSDLLRLERDSSLLGLSIKNAIPGSIEYKRFVEASPVSYVSPDAAPFLLMHGDADQTVPFDQSEIMADALEKAGVEVKLLRVPGGGHGPVFRGTKNPPDYVGGMVRWFDRFIPKHS